MDIEREIIRPYRKALRKNAHAVALGRRGGQARSEKKTQAARANGKKGGRPKLSKEG